jgi:signal transduction histidine kinase
LRILLVEDSTRDAERIVHELRRGGYDPIHERVDTAPAMTAALERQPWDLVISDHALPGFNALAALELLKNTGVDLPFLIVSGALGEEMAVAAMKAGAHDYLMKNKWGRLLPAIERLLKEAEVRRQRNRAEAQLQSKTTALENALRESEEQFRLSRERMRALAVRLQSAREEERTKVAREIHDELGQALTGLKMELAWLAKRTKPTGEAGAISAVKQKFESMSNLLDQTIHTVRRIATELRPGVLDDLGLSAAIEWYLQEFQRRTGLGCDLGMDANRMDYLGPDRSTAVFRIFQEILTNVARHAQATKVSVNITEQGCNLVLKVQDDGRGITEEQVLGTQSLGLLGMQERVHVFGGSISFVGKRGQGTTVLVLIPLEKEGPSEDSRGG